MLNGANLSGRMREKLWAESVRTATMIDVVLCEKGKDCAYKRFFRKEPNYIRKPRIFGELGILKKNKKIFSKLENKGQTCMFVGYSQLTHTDYICWEQEE